MINIDSKTSIKTLEESYVKLFKNAEVDITISKTLTSADFGLIPAIIQFFATWYNHTTKSKIIFKIKTENDLEEYYKLDYLFPCLTYCWSRNMVDENGKDLKPALKTLNLTKHDKMKMQTDGGGNQVLLSCFDHLSITKGLLNSFYIDGTFISNETQFDFAIDKPIKQVINFNRSLRDANYRSQHPDIIAIIYELMKNTDDWGRTDEFNKPLNPNTRGLFLKLHKRSRDSFIKSFAGYDVLKDYFSHKSFEGNSKDELYFLEISVYDSGIGFIKRNLGTDYEKIESQEQIKIVKACMIKNNTSAVGLDKEVKGQGLDRIMGILDNKGLFWLRTENVSIFRNLRVNRYKEDTSTSDIDLYDMFNNSKTKFSNLELAKGSVVTLVYPISNISNA